MSILADITTLEAKKKQFDLLALSDNLDITKRYELEILKEEMVNILSNIFCVYSNNVVSNSFYLQVNEVEKQICELILKKNEELNLISQEKENINTLSKKIITHISSAYILDNDIHIGLNIDKRLLDIKNDIINSRLNTKRLSALKFVEDKLDNYIIGLKSLITIITENNEKTSISFKKRQEIFEIFNSISLKQQIDKNHTKMFNESVTDTSIDIYSTDYIKWYENILLENCDTIGLNLSSFYFEICNYLNDSTISTDSILNFIDDYIYKKYNVEIDAFKKMLTNLTDKANASIKYQLSKCYSCNDEFNFDSLLIKIESDSYLLNIFDNKNCKDIVKKVHLRNKISVRNNVILYTVLDDLNKIILKNFDFDQYMQIYMVNYKYKNRQIAGFRAYFSDILELAKKELTKIYIERMENTILNEKNNNLNIDSIMKKYDDKKSEIEELNQALNYINKNYRDFGEENIKLYLKGIENRYSVSNLYEKISSRSSNIIYKLKTKNVIKKELPYIRSFIDNKDLLNSIKETIINNIIVNQTLINELNSNIK